jgi:hypothetical protein
MTKLLIVRCAGVLGATALALIFVGLIPFLSVDPAAHAGFGARTPAVLVNRAFKGDRLPLPSEANRAVSRGDSDRQQHVQKPKDVPDGCDTAFSPISSPRLAYFYGRCTT